MLQSAHILRRIALPTRILNSQYYNVRSSLSLSVRYASVAASQPRTQASEHHYTDVLQDERFNPTNVVDRYHEDVKQGRIQHSHEQVAMVELLQDLENQCKYWETLRRDESTMLYLAHLRDLPPRGIYVHGTVGVGKSMLVDMFYDVSEFSAKKRFHFHEFVSDIHKRIYQWQQLGAPTMTEHEFLHASGQRRQSSVTRPERGDKFSVDTSNPLEGEIYHAMKGLRRRVVGAEEEEADKPCKSAGTDESFSSKGNGTTSGGSDGTGTPAPPSNVIHGALPYIARDLLEDACLFCFDEFQVTDPGDAHILGHLFSELIKLGAICVFTSNRAPEDLFQVGFRRGFFLPFVNTIHANLDVYNLASVAGDYRTLTTTLDGAFVVTGARSNPAITDGESPDRDNNSGEDAGSTPAQSLVKLGDNNPDAEAWKMYHTMVARALTIPGVEAQEAMHPFSVQVAKGRYIHGVCAQSQVGLFTFSQLCGRPHGAGDYRALARVLRTVVISTVPCFDWDHRSFGRRFITLIDELYESRVQVRVTACVPLDRLFQYDLDRQARTGDEDGVGAEAPHAPRVFDDNSTDLGVTTIAETDERFAIHRCLSRLRHMSSKEYLSETWIAEDRDARSRIENEFT